MMIELRVSAKEELFLNEWQEREIFITIDGREVLFKGTFSCKGETFITLIRTLLESLQQKYGPHA